MGKGNILAAESGPVLVQVHRHGRDFRKLRSGRFDLPEVDVVVPRKEGLVGVREILGKVGELGEGEGSSVQVPAVLADSGKCVEGGQVGGQARELRGE